MLHLIPQQQKKIVLREYRKRLAIVICASITVIMIIGSVFLMPSYVLSKDRHDEVAAKNSNINGEISAMKQSIDSQSVQKISDSINLLQPLGSPISPSVAFNKFLPYTVSNGIQVSYLDYIPNSDNTVTLDVTGVAPTRDSLATFIQQLKTDPYFSGVSLPLSNFIKETNIDFSIKIGVSMPAATTTSNT